MDKKFFKNQMKRLITELTSVNTKRMTKLERDAYQSDLEDCFEQFNKITKNFEIIYGDYLNKLTL